MINEDILGERIARIRHLLPNLIRLREISLEEFENDEDMQLIIERSVQVIAQAILDIGNHIIAHFGWEKPGTYKSVISLLVKKSIISNEHKSHLEGLAGLRNLLDCELHLPPQKQTKIKWPKIL